MIMKGQSHDRFIIMMKFRIPGKIVIVLKYTPAYCMVSPKLSVPNCVTVLDSSHNEWGDGGIKCDLVERRVSENNYCALSAFCS